MRGTNPLGLPWFRFKRPPGGRRISPRMWRQTFLLGLPVGLMQAGLNQGDHWWREEVDAAVIAKSILSPLLSCAIAFFSALLASNHSTASGSS